MEDFDIFTNEINFTQPLYKNILHKYVNEIPATPNGMNYQSGRKLMAEECLVNNDDAGCAFYFSEAVSATLRTMAVYRDEQLKAADNKLHNIKSCIQPINELADAEVINTNEDMFFDILTGTEDVTNVLEALAIEEDVPLHVRYLKFTKENNVENFEKILKELPKEWTIVQITAPYNPNENLESFNEYRSEIDSIYLSVFTNDYLEDLGLGPLTVNIPANVTKEGESPLFRELYSVLDENYKTIDNAQFLNNKRLVQNYWSRREDIDLRMKSVINLMEKDWLGGWSSLLTGKLINKTLKGKVMDAVDRTIADWGFVKLTKKQKFLLYNLIETCPVLQSQQTKTCIRRILTEHGNPEDVRQSLPNDCQNCTKEFRLVNELCLKCLSRCFEAVHHFTLVDGIRAFSQLAMEWRDNDDLGLKKAKRHPVILIVDEMLDPFPWETLPILNPHPVSRMENIHFTYYLYKVHEKNIVNGNFMAKCDVGRYVINPEKNLDRMEKRMSSFVKYWCEHWTGHIGEPPAADDFLRHLNEADIFLYCGHGDGCHLGNGGARGAGVEGGRARALALLAGCGSVRLARPPARRPPAAAHHHLHVACCPLVVGMVWEVTDLEVDKVVSTLLALSVPSARASWPAVGKLRWSQGLLEPPAEAGPPQAVEREVLRAVCRARGSTHYTMIASSVVARGLPVQLAG